jgi:Superinfection immunity protein
VVEALMFWQSSDDSGGAVVLVLILIAVSLFVYFAPALVARGKPQFASVLVLDIFLGWTLVGWVVALAWALKKEPTATPITNQIPTGPAVLCADCGKYSAPGAQFCSYCGSRFAI